MSGRYVVTEGLLMIWEVVLTKLLYEDYDVKGNIVDVHVEN